MKKYSCFYFTKYIELVKSKFPSLHGIISSKLHKIQNKFMHGWFFYKKMTFVVVVVVVLISKSKL